MGGFGAWRADGGIGQLARILGHLRLPDRLSIWPRTMGRRQDAQGPGALVHAGFERSGAGHAHLGVLLLGGHDRERNHGTDQQWRAPSAPILLHDAWCWDPAYGDRFAPR